GWCKRLPREMERRIMKSWIRNHRKLVISSATLIAAFFIYRAVRADPRLAEIRQKRDEIMAKMQQTADPEEQKRLWGEFRETMKDLTPEQRRVLGADARKRVTRKKSAISRSALTKRPNGWIGKLTAWKR